MNKKELPTWMEAVGCFGLLADIFIALALILYLLEKHCESFLKVLLFVLCGLLMLGGLMYLMWLIVRKFKIKDND